MKEIHKIVPKTNNLYTISNYGKLINTKTKCEVYSHITYKGYRCAHIFYDSKYRSLKISQIIAIAFLNHIPNGNKLVVDHKDNIKLNNRLDNLQIITNRLNSSKDIDKTKTTSKYIGVSYDKERGNWQSKIKINGKTKNLGRFDSEGRASIAYQFGLFQLDKIKAMQTE